MAPECCICLYELKSDLCVLKCSHVFHIACIRHMRKQVTRGNAKCPLCRKEVMGILPLFFTFNNENSQLGSVAAALPGESLVSGGQATGEVIVISDGDEEGHSPENTRSASGDADDEIHDEDLMILTGPSEEEVRVARMIRDLRDQNEVLRTELNESGLHIRELEEDLEAAEQESVEKVVELETKLRVMTRQYESGKAELEERRLGWQNEKNEMLRLASFRGEEYRSAVVRLENQIVMLHKDNEELRANLDSLRLVRLGSEVEMAVKTLSKVQFSEHLDQLRRQPPMDLAQQLAIALETARRQGTYVASIPRWGC